MIDEVGAAIDSKCRPDLELEIEIHFTVR